MYTTEKQRMLDEIVGFFHRKPFNYTPALIAEIREWYALRPIGVIRVHHNILKASESRCK